MKHKREDMPLLGQKINDYRKMKKGYTIEKFAEELGVCVEYFLPSTLMLRMFISQHHQQPSVTEKTKRRTKGN